MPTRVFLLRHGESADPTVFHGAESDVDLGERGRRQAEVVAEVLARRRPDVLISSGMRRARQTALPIARACGLELLIEPQLHERRVGVLSGKPFHTDDVWPETLKRWTSGDTGYAHQDAESFDDIRGRVVPVWERLVEQHAGKTLVVVAHGVVCKTLLVSVLARWHVADWPKLGSLRNCGISELIDNGRGWEALVLNQQPEEIRERGLE